MSTKKNTKYAFSEIVKRLMELKGIDKDYKLAELLGINKTTLSEQKRQNRIPFEELLEFAESEGLLFEWIMTGEGPQKKSAYMITTENGPYIAETLEIMRRVDPDTQADIRRCAKEKELLAKIMQQQIDKEAS